VEYDFAGREITEIITYFVDRKGLILLHYYYSVVRAEGHGGFGMNRKGLTIIDAVISLCLIGVLFLVVVPRYQRVAREAQEAALKAELRNIRTTIRVFKILNRRNPGSIRELVEKKVVMPARVGADPYTGSIFSDNYLMPNAVDKKGNVLDAFGNTYTYDSLNGIVRSTTQGYEDW
jgi:competence protein ComGC